MEKLYLPPESITEQEHETLRVVRIKMKEENPMFPENCCAVTAQVIQELLNWEMVGVRCKLQRIVDSDSYLNGYRRHANNRHPKGFLVDTTLEQFDYRKMGFLDGSVAEDASSELHRAIGNGIPAIALLEEYTPFFEKDEMAQLELDHAGMDISTMIVLHRINPKKYRHPYKPEL